MNQELWEKHLLQRVTELTREIKNLRTEVRTQRLRAETWKTRALRKTIRR